MRKGDWLQTYTGIKFYPLDPRPSEIDIRDIAHSLSLICRYGGHTIHHYSVAQHCLLLSYLVPAEVALEALLHDSAEPYIGDITAPVKRSISEILVKAGVGDLLKDIEDRIEVTVAEKFGLQWPWPAIVKEYDTRILGDERAALMLSERVLPWRDSGDPLNVAITKWSPGAVESTFINRFDQLVERRNARLMASNAGPVGFAPEALDEIEKGVKAVLSAEEQADVQRIASNLAPDLQGGPTQAKAKSK